MEYEEALSVGSFGIPGPVGLGVFPDVREVPEFHGGTISKTSRNVKKLLDASQDLLGL
jgi:hypothetical protein